MSPVVDGSTLGAVLRSAHRPDGAVLGGLDAAVAPCLAALGRRVTVGTRAAVARELTRAVEALLDLDLGDVLVGAWRRLDALNDAARTTAQDGSTSVVQLASHCVTYESTPSFDVLVDERRVATVQLQLQVTIAVTGLAATVRAGVLVDLPLPSCRVQCVLSVEGCEVLTEQVETRVPVAVQLGDGIVLCERAPEQRSAGGGTTTAVLPVQPVS